MTALLHRHLVRCAASVLVVGVVVGCGSATANHKLLVAGATAINDTGCEACHMIGTNGNSGPGPNLTTIGAHLSATQITRALDNPTSPMPTFRYLPQPMFKAIVAYLASLKSRADVIAAGFRTPKPVPLSREYVCKNRKRFYASIVGGFNGGQGHALTPKNRSQFERALQALCDMPGPKGR